MKTALIGLFFIINTLLFSVFAQKKHTISGFVTEKGSKELLIGATVYFPQLKTGTVTNNYGFYSLLLVEGEHQLQCSYVGYQQFAQLINIKSDIRLDIELGGIQELDAVEVSSSSNKISTRSSQMSVVELPIAQIQKLPSLLGEKDVLKTLQLTPGVQSGSEGNSGLYVRGGGPDQNLLILDDAPVYNASHLFGFFSIFNGDALKNISLTKGGFPARYGGRLSSVLEMNMKDGNKEKFSGEVGIGLVASRLLLEAPIVKGKSSFIISGRRTYIDLLAQPLLPKNNRLGYFFYDLNAKVNYDFGQKNKLFLSGYFGRDKFHFTDKEKNGNKFAGGLHWGNATATLRWNHLFNYKTFANTSLIFSDYTFSIAQQDSYNTFDYDLKYDSGIKDLGIKHDLQTAVSQHYLLRAGLSSTFHQFSPSAVVVKNSSVNQLDRKIEIIKTVESGIYLENELTLWEKLRLNAGLRYSFYIHQNKNYQALEPRFSASYALPDDWLLKASYASMNQYVHLLSSTGVSLPMDLWIPSTNKIKPQHAQQIAAGIAKDFLDKNISFSLEGYYKKMNNIIGYAPGANFLLVDKLDTASEYTWQESVIRGQGWSYGAELLLQRKTGRLSGWLGYTLSWTQHQFDADNNGQKFYPRYDRRHDLSLVAIYNLSDKITISGTWVYGSGNAISLPNADYQVGDAHPNNILRNYTVHSYGKKNDFRMRDYHRLDLAVQFHKTTKRNWKRIWEIGLYNVYSRRNPFFYQIKEKGTGEFQNGKEIKTNVLEQYSIFPIIPSVTYNLKF
ncbi:TonB-dependent receptor [Capnocytophaga sp.]|uniref:TonB-dependent receptor n=1 Tax=Capnocytophaga sp. TaxID=44737 RepID=UPI0026DA74A7|nr:TonB-dependent receptor [Capnocytophaga sp.]MDO5105234.1 TonB-dependent receptor [Capnocytophaga sp.]